MSDDIIDPKLFAHWFATVQRARAELNIYAAAYGPSRDTEKTISKLDALLAGSIPDEIDDWSEARILDLGRRAGLVGFEDRHTKPLLRFARALLASPHATASDALKAEPVEIPNPDGWMTVKVDGLPDVGETVLGGLWHTDSWLKGVISVFRESSTEFPRPGLTSGSAAVRGIPKVFECGAGLDRLDEPSRPPPLAGPGVAGSVAVRY